MEKELVRAARVRAVLMAIMCAITVISFTYGYMQAGIARSNERMAKEYLKMSVECEAKNQKLLQDMDALSSKMDRQQAQLQEILSRLTNKPK